jgi:hypothetical protein
MPELAVEGDGRPEAAIEAMNALLQLADIRRRRCAATTT